MGSLIFCRTVFSKVFVATRHSRSYPSIFATPLCSRSSLSILPIRRLRPIVSAVGQVSVSPSIGLRCFSTQQTSSSLNDPSPNWSNRPPKETILLDGCDFEHWLVVMEKPEGDPTRDEIIDSYIKTLAQVVGSEEEARMKIYSVSTRCYFAFGALVSEELSYKLKELPRVRWVLPDSYLDVKNKDYGGEPFIDGQAVPYDPKYHEEWIRNNNRATERNRRNDGRPRQFDRSRNFDRRPGGMGSSGMSPPPPNQQQPMGGMPPPGPGMGGMQQQSPNFSPGMGGNMPPRPPAGMGGMPPPGPGMGGMHPPGPGMGGMQQQSPNYSPSGMGGNMPPRPPAGMGGMHPPGPGMGGMPSSGPGMGGMPPSGPGMGGMPPGGPGMGGMQRMAPPPGPGMGGMQCPNNMPPSPGSGMGGMAPPGGPGMGGMAPPGGPGMGGMVPPGGPGMGGMAPPGGLGGMQRQPNMGGMPPQNNYTGMPMGNNAGGFPQSNFQGNAGWSGGNDGAANLQNRDAEDIGYRNTGGGGN